MSTEDSPIVAEGLGRVAGRLAVAREEIERVVVGQDTIVDQVLIALFAGGHVLLEGAPGLGKTLLVRTLGTVFGLDTARIQFTPDLMPADITGTNVLVHDEAGGMHTRFQPGPVFTQLLLADEINRATPKTQSALLEAMQEQTVTVAGVERSLPEPFVVMATQNPIEMEGTYVLPEAQVDRFFLKVVVELPSEDVLDDVLRMTTGSEIMVATQRFGPEEVLSLQELVKAVPVASHVRRAVARFVIATHADRTRFEDVRRHVRFGISPRGAQSWLLAAKGRALLEGRHAVDYDDLAHMLVPALRHRLQLGFEAQREGRTVEGVLRSVYDRVVVAAA